MAKNNSFTARAFPEDAWSPSERDTINGPVKYLPDDWCQKIQLPSPDPALIEDECRAVLKATLKRKARRDEILLEADRAVALIWPVQQIVGNPDDPIPRPATNNMLHMALLDLDPVIFHFKTKFNRGRPYHCCNLPLEPMFQRPDRLYPGHPSYPSGHSSQAHLAARLLGAMFPSLEAKMLKAADRVAHNRVVAGLHFDSDSHAGELLAKQVVDLLLANPAFGRMVANAKAEWPELA